MLGPSVLIVDDHDGFRSIAREVLSQAGYRVVGEAADGRTALEAAARFRPSVVLLDVQLPGLDGFDVAARLLLTPNPPRIVFVSTRDAEDYAGRVAASGAAGYVTKARLSGDTLRAALEESARGMDR